MWQNQYYVPFIIVPGVYLQGSAQDYRPTCWYLKEIAWENVAHDVVRYIIRPYTVVKQTRRMKSEE
jgi:hypothetical protein